MAGGLPLVNFGRGMGDFWVFMEERWRIAGDKGVVVSIPRPTTTLLGH